MKPIGVELFAGAGGLSAGLNKAGVDVVLANEIEPDFCETYRLNHPSTRLINRDIHDVDFYLELNEAGIPSGGVLVVSGGPPCQGFSTVGSKNSRDPRNSLFYEFLRAVHAIHPYFVVFENVAGFIRLYDGQAHKTLISELNALGYSCITGILDASDFGLPQFRKRAIVIGTRVKGLKVELPEPTHGNSNLFASNRRLTLMDAISDLPDLEAGQEKTQYKCSPQNDYQILMRKNQDRLTEHNAANYGNKMQEILSLIPPGGSVLDLPERLRPKSFFANTYARLLPDQPSPTVTRNFGTPSSSRCVHPFQQRALSTREGARLQGFPDNYAFFGSKVSKNLQIGNSVPPILGEVIGKCILSVL